MADGDNNVLRFSELSLYDEKIKEYINSRPGGGGTITIDDTLSNSSTNPVQNKVINSALNTKFDISDNMENTIDNDDTVPFYDTSATAKKKITWTNLKTVLQLYFDNLYNKYILPTASTSTLGGVKIDNFTTKINNDGVLSTGSEVITVLTMPEPSADYLHKIVHCIGDSGFQNGHYYMCVGNTDSNAAQQPYKWVWRGDLRVAPTASDTNIGMVRPDGTTIQITSGGVISASGGSSLNVLSYDETLDILGLPPNPIYKLRIVTPVMTSDTTPSGVASASGVSDSTRFAAYKVFDGSENTRWTGTQNLTNHWLQYKFDEAKIIPKIEIMAGAPDIQPTYRDMTVTIQGSNDGATFVDLGSDQILAGNNLRYKTITFNNEIAYLYYRLQFDGYNVSFSGGNWTCIVEIKMYERYLA